MYNYDAIPVFRNKNSTDYLLVGYSFGYSEKGFVVFGYKTVGESMMEYDELDIENGDFDWRNAEYSFSDKD